MYAVLVASRRERLAVAWLAFGLAGLGFAAHPTGFTLLAPLLAGLPLLWRLVAVPGAAMTTTLRALAVASGGMVAPLLAFADGGLRDFLRGQQIFLSIPAQDSWATEIQRYSFLLSQIPMGNYAKRAAVLLCLVSLAWFAVLAAAARLRRIQLPVTLWLSGVDDRAGVRGAVAHAVEVDAPLRRARRRRLRVPRAIPGARGPDGAQRARDVAAAVRAGGRRGGVVRAGHRVELARPEPVALRLAGRGA
jgi:hypothetical protein